MPMYKKKGPDSSGPAIDRWLTCLLALRLRQLEDTFGSYREFAERTGLSRGTLQLLRSGRGNPTFQTLTTLSESLGVSVWSLLGIQDENLRSNIEAFGLPYEQIQQQLSRAEMSRASIRRLTGSRKRKGD